MKTYPVSFFLLLFPLLLTAQPDYSFQSAVLESGTALQTGAVYRFSTVKTGVDALVTITYLTPGCSIPQIDNDGGVGYTAAFQPEILVPDHSSGYAEFHIAFVTTGTSTPMTMTEIPATALDIDGNNGLWGGPLNEYDGISMGASSYVDYNLLNGQLSVSYSAGWVQALNTGGNEYGGISTSNTSVMITTVNANASSFDYRTGVNNQSNLSTLARQKSLYFRKFTYPNSILAPPAVTLFTGTQHNGAATLHWTLSNTSHLQQVTVERSQDGKIFTALKTFLVNNPAIDASGRFQYTDASPSFSQQVYYRLQLTASTNRIEYSRQLLLSNTGSAHATALDVFPSVIPRACGTDATIRFTAEKNGPAELHLLHSNGNEVMYKQWNAGAGTNSFHFTIDTRLAAGVYIVLISTNGKVNSKKILIQ